MQIWTLCREYLQHKASSLTMTHRYYFEQRAKAATLPYRPYVLKVACCSENPTAPELLCASIKQGWTCLVQNSDISAAMLIAQTINTSQSKQTHTNELEPPQERKTV